MAIVNAKEILLEATRYKYAVGAFNITNLNQFEAVVEAAINKRSPIIIQTSVTPARFLNPEVIGAIYKTIAQDAPIPICLHLDHCDDVAFCKTCVNAGYTNIMIDASKHDLEENIRQTKEVVDYCHNLDDISVEGELGTISGIEDQVNVSEDQAQLCDPSQAVEFVLRTGIDLFAPAIGTAHGVYKTRNPKLDFSRFEIIAHMLNGKMAKIPLVIHGGTGLSEDTVKKLVSLGGAKFNVATDLKHTLIDATYDYIVEHRHEYNPGRIDIAARQAITDRINFFIDLLGSANKA